MNASGSASGHQCENAGVGDGEVRPGGYRHLEAGRAQTGAEHVALVAQVAGDPAEELVAEPEAGGDRGLERTAVHVGEELLDREHR